MNDPTPRGKQCIELVGYLRHLLSFSPEVTKAPKGSQFKNVVADLLIIRCAFGTTQDP